jgi:hypothetical protein
VSDSQSGFAFDLNRDVRTVEAMAAGLKPYIYEDELYGPMPGDLPKLTIGGLLMRLNRLSVLPDLLSPSQRDTVKAAQSQFDEVRKEWAVAYEGKIQRELKVRISALDQFFIECADNLRGCADEYPSMIEKRVMAELLHDEAIALKSASPGLTGGLTALDNKIHRYFEKGNFVWDSRLEPAYPPTKYWFLYGRPSKKPPQG